MSRDVWSQEIATFIYCSVQRGIKQISFSKLPLCDVSVPLPLFFGSCSYSSTHTPHHSPSYNISSLLPQRLPSTPPTPSLIYRTVCLLGISQSPRLEIGARGRVGMVFSQWEFQGTEFSPYPAKASCLLLSRPLVTQRRAPAWGLSSSPCSLPAPPTSALKWR